MDRLTPTVLARLAEDAQAHIDGHRYDYVLLPDTLLALLAEVTAFRAIEKAARCDECNVCGALNDALSTLERLPS